MADSRVRNATAIFSIENSYKQWNNRKNKNGIRGMLVVDIESPKLNKYIRFQNWLLKSSTGLPYDAQDIYLPFSPAAVLTFSLFED